MCTVFQVSILFESLACGNTITYQGAITLQVLGDNHIKKPLLRAKANGPWQPPLGGPEEARRLGYVTTDSISCRWIEFVCL